MLLTKLSTSTFFLPRLKLGQSLPSFPLSAIALPQETLLVSHLLVQIKLFYGKRTFDLCIKITPSQVAFNLQCHTKLLIFSYLDSWVNDHIKNITLKFTQTHIFRIYWIFKCLGNTKTRFLERIDLRRNCGTWKFFKKFKNTHKTLKE